MNTTPQITMTSRMNSKIAPIKIQLKWCLPYIFNLSSPVKAPKAKHGGGCERRNKLNFHRAAPKANLITLTLWIHKKGQGAGGYCTRSVNFGGRRKTELNPDVCTALRDERG